MKYRIAHLDYRGHVVARQIVTEVNVNELNKRHGVGGWVAVPVEQNVQWGEVTIVNGQLVPASDELIAERQALRLAAETQAVTQARAARYTAQTDALLFDAMEQFALDHPENEALAAWLVAKNQVRAELPKPTNNQNTIQQ